MKAQEKLDSKNIQENSLLGIYGSGGYAREVMPLAAEQFDDSKSVRLVFIDDDKCSEFINGYRVLSFDEFISAKCSVHYFNVAIGDSNIRESIVEKNISNDVIPVSLHAKNLTNYDSNLIDDGAILCANVTLTSNAKIGKYFHANIYSYIAHDCIIEDFVTFAPRVCCNGNVHIHKHAYIGTNAVLRQGTSTKPLVIGEGAVVGMGAVVTKDVEPYTTVVGNPARPITK